MKRYKITYEIFKTEEEARAFCKHYNTTATAYIRKTKPAKYYPRYHDKTKAVIDDWLVWYYH